MRRKEKEQAQQNAGDRGHHADQREQIRCRANPVHTSSVVSHLNSTLLT
jgi:hypothetical protein